MNYRHAIDIKFTDTESICVSDAAYHHLFYSTRTDTFTSPQPYIIPTPVQPGSMKPITVAQQFKFTPFEQFASLLSTLESWIFDSTDTKKNEASAVSLQHGLLCSASLCQHILQKLQAMV